MANKKMKLAYDQRDDLQKISSQWTKLSGLHDRSEWSAAVIRAATACEIAVNLAIRREFADRSKFDTDFIDGLLKWANGLSGKMDRLLLPLTKGTNNHKPTKALCELAREINDKRNEIAHRGNFCSREEATRLIAKCKQFVEGIVAKYENDFELRESC